MMNLERLALSAIALALTTSPVWADPVLVGDYELTGKQGRRSVSVELTIATGQDGKLNVTRTATGVSGRWAPRTWSGVGLRYGNRARILFHAEDDPSGHLVDGLDPDADAPSFTNVITATYTLSSDGETLRERLFNLTKRGDERHWRRGSSRGKRLVPEPDPTPGTLPDTIPGLVAALRAIFEGGNHGGQAAGSDDGPLVMIERYMINKLGEDEEEFLYDEDVERFFSDEQRAATIRFDLVLAEVTDQIQSAFKGPDAPAKQQLAGRILTKLKGKDVIFGTEGYELNACGQPTSFLLVVDPAGDYVHGIDLWPCVR